MIAGSSLSLMKMEKRHYNYNFIVYSNEGA